MKKQLSSFDIYVIVNELKNFKNAYIDKIYQLSYDEILIRIKNVNTPQRHNGHKGKEKHNLQGASFGTSQEGGDVADTWAPGFKKRRQWMCYWVI